MVPIGAGFHLVPDARFQLVPIGAEFHLVPIGAEFHLVPIGAEF